MARRRKRLARELRRHACTARREQGHELPRRARAKPRRGAARARPRGRRRGRERGRRRPSQHRRRRRGARRPGSHRVPPPDRGACAARSTRPSRSELENRAVDLQDELDHLVAELARAFGLGGRERRAASAAERARLNVTRALRTAVARITAVLPEAGAALDRGIRTGLYCAFAPKPGEGVRWIVQS